MSKNSSNPRGLSGKEIARIFVIYFVLYCMLATLALFGVKALVQPFGITVIAIGSVVVPAVATLVHVRKGKKDGIDDIASRLK